MTYSGIVSAFEAISPHPGTRAMGMAGVFGPQADDCSAVWYNPGGLQRADMIQSDMTIEYGALPRGISEREYDAASTLKFMCGYWAVKDRGIGAGIAYATLYRLEFDVDEIVQPLSVQSFGATDITYHQGSIWLSAPLNERLAVGGTLDFVWTGVECSYDTCVDIGPLALGASVGAALDVARTPSRRIAVSGLWRTRAALRYRDTPGSGIGAILDEYIPDRPQTLGIGMHVQFSTRHAAVNTNVTLEHIAWSSASAVRAPAPDFNKFGAGGEVIVPISDGISIAARVGATRARANRGGATANVYALGTGITWNRGHGIDLAFERREYKDSVTDKINHISVSYSWQR